MMLPGFFSVTTGSCSGLWDEGVLSFSVWKLLAVAADACLSSVMARMAVDVPVLFNSDQDLQLQIMS